MKISKWLIKNTKDYWRYIVILVIVITAISVFNVLNSISFQLLLDKGTKNNSLPISFVVIFPILVIAFRALFTGIQYYYQNKMILKVAGLMKETLLEHIERISLEDSKNYHTGDFLTRLSSDTELSAKIIPESFINIVYGIVSSVFAIAYAFFLSWKITLAVIVLSPLIMIWSRLLLPHLQKWNIKTKEADALVQSFTQEQLLNLISIKSFSNYDISKNLFKKNYEEKIKYHLKAVKLQSLLNSGGYFIGFLSFICSLCMGVYFVLKGEMTIGSIIGFTQLTNFIIWPFTEMIPMFGNLQTNIASTRRILEIINIKKEEKETLEEIEKKDVWIEFSHVYFGYSKEQFLFHDFNLSLGSKGLIGVIGPSGCGKSTFLKLLLGLYQPMAGEIYILYENEKIVKSNMRKLISYVPQDHVLFSGTLEDNIKYGNEKATKEQIIEAAKKANIHEVIEKLQEGYKTRVEEGGKNFSFGQAQRIAIARALIKDSPILILDEPTASLDKESYDLIINTLKEESKNRLCIMVSHILNIEEYCDKVLRF